MPFSLHLREQSRKSSLPATTTTANFASSPPLIDRIPQLPSAMSGSNRNDSAATDSTVWGHRLFGESKACAESVAACSGHHQRLVRGQPGTTWPCYSARDVGTMTDDVVRTDPVKSGLLLDYGRPTVPMYLVGYIGDEPVYKTTNTPPMDHHNNAPPPYQPQWPAFVPGMLIGMPVGMPLEQPSCAKACK